MNGPERGGRGLSLRGPAPTRSNWPSILAAGVLLLGCVPAPCAAQPTPAIGPDASLNPGGGSVPAPVMPAPVAMPMPSQPGPMQASISSSISASMPMPMPIQPAPTEPAALPLPVTAVTPLPGLSHDHFGDGVGTVGSSLIWLGQLPQKYGPYEDGAGIVGGPIGPIGHLNTVSPGSHSVLLNGALSYGPPGLHPGFYGFGLSFHPGYGYGGNGLGVGIDGGYPCYGGPGYALHYGYPKFAYPYYEGIGQLVYDRPVVLSDLANAGNFGPYTGASYYAYTHPSYTAEAAATGSFTPGTASYPDTGASTPTPEMTFEGSTMNVAPNPNSLNTAAGRDRYLGMSLEPNVGADGRKGMKIVNILPSSTAEKAGLKVGDIIYASNGYVVEQGGHLAWVIANAAKDNVLTLTVRNATDGKERTVTIEMP